ncbi:MAG TPA: diaminopropionate ammonia-lyase, partial [Alphaproteobacteria bacterium]|nr:diaminopropionate ammonia-lyase [Alphaproteobacteria bacterium]
LGYKDESGRFGLGSFKALGGAYAVLRQLQARLGGISSTELRSGQHRASTAAVTVTCATDGNHGRSVAWGAQLFGCRCVIYIHEKVSQGRADAIARYGAQVRRVPGTYDDAVRQAARDADANGWIVVSDTSYPGYTEIPRDVMQGYTVMMDEALAQWPGAAPTHVFIQAGVGGLAAAVCGHLWETLREKRPRVVVVEPERAACLFESAAQGRAASIHGALDTMMAGLACGETSILAWEILEEGASDFLTVAEEAAATCMRLLADGVDGDPPVVAGESAVAGLAGLLGAAARPALARALGLDASSRVLLFGSEGDTDPALYEKIVGRSAHAVRAR